MRESIKAMEPVMAIDPVEEIIANRESIKRCMARIERLQRNLERENANLIAYSNTEQALISELKGY
jgi:hypothetical protein